MQQLRNIRPSDTATGYRGELVSGGSSECCPCVVPKKAMTLTSMPGARPLPERELLGTLVLEVASECPRPPIRIDQNAPCSPILHPARKWKLFSSQSPFRNFGRTICGTVTAF